MRVNTRTCWGVLVLTLVTSVVPLRQAAGGDSIGNVQPLVRPSGQPTVNDVELLPGGTLTGQVVDASGKPLIGQPIVVQQQGREPIGTRSDNKGRFRLSGLNAGLCRVEYGSAVLACRCWHPRTAPPVAAKELFLIADESIERGQRPIADLLTGPVLIGLIIAAAVAIPIAVHNSQKDAS